MHARWCTPLLLTLGCAAYAPGTTKKVADRASGDEVGAPPASREVVDEAKPAAGAPVAPPTIAEVAPAKKPSAPAPKIEVLDKGTDRPVEEDLARPPDPAPPSPGRATGAEPPKEALAFGDGPAKADPAPGRGGPVDDLGGAVRATLEGPAVAAPAPRPAPRSPGVRAGAADDNLSFGAFLDFLNTNRHRTPEPWDVSSRVVLSVVDADGRPLHDAHVRWRDGPVTERRRTYPDGRALLYLRHDAARGQGVMAEVSYGDVRVKVPLDPARRRKVAVTVPVHRPAPGKVPLDVAFVLDTTGSMGDELDRLKQTIEVIHFQVQNMRPRPDVRFGAVLYRDIGDDYRVRKIPFTRELAQFQRALAGVQAGGGGDYPEDVQAGLRVALKELDWRDRGVRLGFLIGDAPPQTGYGDGFTYVHAMHEAASRGIKIATIGASGLSLEGELVWRQIAQYTMAPFVFLTYGESGDSAGSPSSVSHHVGSNWVAENLDAIVVRLVKTELAHLTPRGAPTREDYFAASASRRIPAEDVLEDLFSQSVRQLLDYSVERIAPRTPTVVLPLTGPVANKGRATLSQRLEIGLSRAGAFQLVEREAQPELLKTIAEQLGKTYDEGKASEVGKLVPAKLAVLGHVGRRDEGRYELLVKLVRIETGEVLSLSLLKIDDGLLM